MESAVVQTLIGAVVALIGAFGATYLSQTLSKIQGLEQNYDDKLEEIQNIYIDIKMHIEAELRDWWIGIEYSDEKY